MTLAELKSKTIYTPQSLKAAVEAGRNVIIFQGGVYDLSKFVRYHPGGQLAIQHMTGQDATDTIMAFHSPEVVDRKMPNYRVGQFLPSSSVIDGDPSLPLAAASLSLEEDYLLLAQRLRKEGFYEPQPLFYAWRLCLFACVLAASVWLVRSHGDSVPHLIASALMLAFVWHGLAFTAHDAGHHSVSTVPKVDDYFGIALAGCVGGLSIGWWRWNHNVHHIVTNDPEHDPDIQHMPFMAVSTRFFDGLYSSFHKRVMEFDWFARVMVSVQHFLYFPIMSFGRFNLYAQSFIYLSRMDKDDRPQYRFLELGAIAIFWTWFGYGILYCCIPSWPLRLMYLYLSHAATLILHVQITLSHFSMSTEVVEGESFVRKAIRTTMNVDCPEWFDWFHGGLQFQIEHHLFPRVPRYHFRRLQPLVQELCAKHGLQYHIYGFVEGNGITLSAMQQVAAQVKLLATAADPIHRVKSS